MAIRLELGTIGAAVCDAPAEAVEFLRLWHAQASDAEPAVRAPAARRPIEPETQKAGAQAEATIAGVRAAIQSPKHRAVWDRIVTGGKDGATTKDMLGAGLLGHPKSGGGFAMTIKGVAKGFGVPVETIMTSERIGDARLKTKTTRFVCVLTK